MIHNLFAFNDSKNIISSYRNLENRARTVLAIGEKRDPLVEILAFCLMPNHIHLLIRQVQDNGISNFMRKNGAGYGGYRNKKYNRSGHLFSGRFRVVHVKDDKQLMTVVVYIHSNPVAIIYPGWKEKGIENVAKAMNFLKSYKWSSFSDLIEIERFPLLINKNQLLELLGKNFNFEKSVEDWLFHKKELYNFDKLAIE